MSLAVERSIARRVGGGRLRQYIDRAQRMGAGVVIGNAGSLTATAVITSGLGMVFWSYAARNYPAASVGLAAAAVSATTLLGTFSVLGFGTLLLGEVAASPRSQGSLLTTALLITGGLGCLLGVGLALVGPAILPDLQTLRASPAAFAFFAAAVGGTTVGLITDQFLVGLLRSELQLARNTLYALAKLAALVVGAYLLVTDQAMLIFGAWPIGNLVSLIALGLYLQVREDLVWRGRPRWDLVRRLGGTALAHHSLNLSLTAPALILPVLVTVVLSPEANAYFYTGWMMASVTFMPQTSLSMTLFAIGMRQPEVLAERARLTLAVGFAGGVAAVLVVQLAAPLVLSIFGSTYAQQATPGLRLLSLAVLPLVIKNHFVCASRVRRRVRSASVIVGTGAVLELVCAGLGGSLAGLQGVCVGWLLAMCAEAAYMAPSVWRLARGRLA